MSAPSRPSPWAALVRRFGWRAYAVPVLAVMTIVVLLRPGGSTADEAQHPAAPAAAPSTTASTEQLSAPQARQPNRRTSAAHGDGRDGALTPPVCLTPGPDP